MAKTTTIYEEGDYFVRGDYLYHIKAVDSSGKIAFVLFDDTDGKWKSHVYIDEASDSWAPVSKEFVDKAITHSIKKGWFFR